MHPCDHQAASLFYCVVAVARVGSLTTGPPAIPPRPRVVPEGRLGEKGVYGVVGPQSVSVVGFSCGGVMPEPWRAWRLSELPKVPLLWGHFKFPFPLLG